MISQVIDSSWNPILSSLYQPPLDFLNTNILPNIKYYPEKENIFASLLGNQKKHYINSEIKEYLGSYDNSFKALENIKDANCIQARMPFDPNIQ